MAHAYHCPNCKTNRTRFNIVEQQPRIVKLDADTGDVIEEYSSETVDPFHLTYQGPDVKVQCGVCGLLENEEMFLKYATYARRKENP